MNVSINHFLLALLCSLSVAAALSQNPKFARNKGYQTFVYRIPADSAEKYILKDSIPVDVYLARQADYTSPIENCDVSLLPGGHYILLSVVDNKIRAEIAANSSLVAYVINNGKYIQLAVRDKTGATVDDARAWMNRKPLRFSEKTQTFRIRSRPGEDDLVKVCSATDTIFLSLDVDKEEYESVLKQKWRIFKSTKTGRVITFLPRRIIALVDHRSWYKPRRPAGKGFVVFNQPKYKLGDTVKLKAYILDAREKRYKKRTHVYLRYFARGKSVQQLLGVVPAAAPGSYILEFVLKDTLVNDISYYVSFTDKKGKQLVTNSFKVEDYVLDEVASYHLRSSKDVYFSTDSLEFMATAKDANGLNLLDAKVRLIVTVSDIENWTRDTLIIADTLYNVEKKLDTKENTRFVIPATELPAATLRLKAKAVFTNSNNEMQEETTDIVYNPGKSELVLVQAGDSIIAEYRVNGIVVPAKGTMEADGDKVDLVQSVAYPSKIKIDPLADTYWFDVENDTSLHESIEINERYDITLSQLSSGDTLGFIISNPYKIPVFYTVMRGDRVVDAGRGASETIAWQTVGKNPVKAYTVRWRYIWAGRERAGETSIGYLYKKLDVNIASSSSVFPGQKDTITIAVKDYRHRPIAGVNLTAFSYNSQFSKDIRVQAPPYLARYRLRRGIRRDTYDNTDAYIIKEYYLGHHQQARNRFGLDTMLYYRMLFPPEKSFDVTTLLNDYYPQVSVHLVQKGIPQKIFLLYLNRRLVYYDGVTDKKNYAFNMPGGYAQLGIRLADRLIEIDSIYIQPNYKHDMFFDLDNLPGHSKTTLLAESLSPSERSLLENSLWQFRGNYSNYMYAWQNNEAVLLRNGYDHIIGPFSRMDSLYFFAPGQFDIAFRFEPGYQYSLSPKILRLEKKKVFPNDNLPVKLSQVKDWKWSAGDTVMNPPVVNYVSKEPVKYISLTTEYRYRYLLPRQGTGSVLFRLEKDTTLSYVIIVEAGNGSPIVLPGSMRQVYNLLPGNYTLLLVQPGFKAIAFPVAIKANHTTCARISTLSFTTSDIVDKLVEHSMNPVIPAPVVFPHDTVAFIPDLPADAIRGNITVEGTVMDEKGKKAIPGAYIKVKGYQWGVIADNNGKFRLPGLKSGRYTLVVSSVGYAVKEREVEVTYPMRNIDVTLRISDVGLQEVVVTGYGLQRKKEMVGAVAMVNAMSLESQLMGKVAGLVVGGDGNLYDANISINIRGARSMSGGNSQPLYVVDGIPYDEFPKNIAPEDIASIEILKDAAAIAVWGSRGANGVVVITTKTKTLRSQFRDYAFWQPQLFTDENGIAKFQVTYPDNVTSWQTYVVAMDRKKRSGSGAALVRSFKPVMAQLSLPQFIVQGDSFVVVSKSLNYTKDRFSIRAGLYSSGVTVANWNYELPASGSVISRQGIVAGDDTLRLQFSIATTTGFKDGEERTLPVYPMGTEETDGKFYTMSGDTSIEYAAKKNGTVHLYVQNNTLDLLLEELDHLRTYPYFCMEQIASKVKGYRMEQQVREALHQEFKHAAELKKLLERLQKAQAYDGSWGWWEKGPADIHITNYILQALLPLRSDALVEMNIRNGLLYLQNQLDRLKNRDLLLASLSTLAQAGHLLDYQPYLSRIPFDSLTLHQQWMYVKIMQQLRLDRKRELQYLVSKQVNTMTGGAFWGEETYRWYNNNNATTVLAYTVLEKEEQYNYLLPQIIQYFLESRSGGYWRNTVESASIVSAILPRVIKNNKSFTEPAVVSISGDTAFSVKKFPFKHSFGNNTRRLNVQKLGGGLTYLTLYQRWWNTAPEPVTRNFIVTTSFANTAGTLTTLRSGERVKMNVDVEALQQAEYVMIEVPVPAGCIIVNKNSNGYVEYYKNKVIFFSELLTKGRHSFQIELECRYSGSYTLNPAKAELMYFPTFYGRDEMRKVKVD